MSEDRPKRPWGAPVALFLFAWFVRALPFGRVFDEDRTVFAGNDAWYHMHRVRESLAAGNWPAILEFDPMLSWPHGARAIWTPLFDAFVALCALPFHAVGGISASEIAAAWLPTLLGALCVVVLYFTARAVANEATARTAGAVLAVLVGHSWYSQVGFLDHHVAVTLVAALTLLAATQFSRAPALGSSVLVSACEAIGLLLWPGSLLHIGLIELGISLSIALTLRASSDSSLAYRNRAWGHAFAFLFVAPFCFGQEWPQWGAYSATVLSLFQPLLFGALAAHALACAIAARFALSSDPAAGSDPAARSRPAAQLAGVAGLAVAVLLGCVAAFPGLRESALEAWSWFGRTEAFQANVAESEPLLFRGGEFSLVPASLRLSWFFLLLPLMWVAFMRRAGKRSDSSPDPQQGPVLTFGIWALGILLAAFFQKRFAHSASLAAALLIAWSLGALFPALARRTSRRVAGLALASLCVLCLAPSIELHATTLGMSLRGELTTANQSKRRLLATADWLRDIAGEERRGVLAPWHLGHPLLYVSGLPMVVGNFGDDIGSENFELAQSYFRSLEPRAARMLDGVDTRFVVVESVSARVRDQFGPRTMYHRLAQPILRNLGEHRLRYASPLDKSAPAAASYRVFERVAGARVVGRAAPGTRVTAHIDLGRPGSRTGRAIVVTEADRAGRYELRLAQAGEDGVGGAWQIEVDDLGHAMAIPAEAVLGGATLAGPNFSTAAN